MILRNVFHVPAAGRAALRRRFIGVAIPSHGHVSEPEVMSRAVRRSGRGPLIRVFLLPTRRITGQQLPSPEVLDARGEPDSLQIEVASLEAPDELLHSSSRRTSGPRSIARPFPPSPNEHHDVMARSIQRNSVHVRLHVCVFLPQDQLLRYRVAVHMHGVCSTSGGSQ